MLLFDPHLHHGEYGINRYVIALLEYAVDQHASDIHVESQYNNEALVRLRIDGQLREASRIPAAAISGVLTKLKLMSEMDIADSRLPQDGRLLTATNRKPLECRVSTCPMIGGEKMVLRLFANSQKAATLSELGMVGVQVEAVESIINQPQGLVLVTGPTGSGKSATLYSLLQQLNQPTRNILTVEDPVEQQLTGINQVAINIKAGLSFAQVLRSFLRQDPDVIMVGEIRDLETAEIALKAAQTGHLVLSTLHTNSAVSTVIRLVHMGLPAYLVAQCLRLVIAQRLVRVTCAHCDGVGCEQCRDGFSGRRGIFEIVNSTNKCNSDGVG